MVLSASAPSALIYEGDSYYFFKSQLKNAIVGIIGMIILSFINYKLFKGRLADFAIIVSIILLALVLVPGIGVTVKGATRWVNLGFVFQPSEIMKISLIVFLAAKLSKDPQKNKKLITGIGPLLLVILVITILLYKEPHMSAIGIILAVSFIIIFAGGMKLSHVLTVIPTGIFVGIWYLLQEEYRVKRLLYIFNPWEDILDSGWQAVQSLYAVGSGGLFGVGLRKQYTKIYVYTRTT